MGRKYLRLTSLASRLRIPAVGIKINVSHGTDVTKPAGVSVNGVHEKRIAVIQLAIDRDEYRRLEKWSRGVQSRDPADFPPCETGSCIAGHMCTQAVSD